jgi:hypothetical protein
MARRQLFPLDRQAAVVTAATVKKLCQIAKKFSIWVFSLCKKPTNHLYTWLTKVSL